MSTEAIATSRGQFEAAVIERFKESGLLEVEIRTELLPREGDDYYDGSVSAYWHFWQASRQVVEMDLSGKEAPVQSIANAPAQEVGQ